MTTTAPPDRRPLTLAALVGLQLVALSGAFLLFTGFGDIVEYDGPLGSARVTGSSPLLIVGVAVLVLGLAALMQRTSRIVFTAIAGGALAATTGALIAIAGPADDIFDLLPDGSAEYRLGGYMAIAAFVAGITGSLAAALSYRRVPALERPEGGRHPLAAPSMAVSVASFLVPFLGPLGVALASTARREIAGWGPDAEGRSGSRTAAVGRVLGLVLTAAWVTASVVGIGYGLSGKL